ncbi:MAG: hypothetical protein JXN65_00530 [Clostridia bacterium]|nr:hypothetical protein [Clostridia bacterium]
MKRMLMYLIMLSVLLLSGCEMGAQQIAATASAVNTPTNTPVPVDTMGITPNVTEQLPSPSPTASATSTVTAAATTAAATTSPVDTELKAQMNAFLPALNTDLYFYGIAETGHYGKLKKSYDNNTDAMYEFNGVYNDGMGTPDKFKVQYFFDYTRGTITEKAGYNERLDKNEFHSKLHNVVVLKLPLALGSSWSHQTKIDGNTYTVKAKVTEYSSDKVSVLYTVTGVPGYFNNTYYEMRTFEKGYGMTSFGNIMPGEIDMTGVDTSDPEAVQAYILNMWMFGYSLNK